jgi:excisionase family DNA binding protein
LGLARRRAIGGPRALAHALMCKRHKDQSPGVCMQLSKPPDVPRFLNVAEIASLLKVKPRTIYEMVAQNRIPYRKPPGSNILRFDLDEIVAWTKARNNK